MLGLGLNLTSITAALLDFVRSGLKMWLPFEKSEILGEDLNEGYDFTSGWSEIDITEKTANTFTSDPDGGVYKTLVEAGKSYKLTIAGTTNASSGIRVGNANDSVEYYSTSSSGAFSDTAIFVATQTNIYVKNKSAGEATITTFKIQEVTQIAPDKSGNSNGATLYTGKALSFDGVNDYVDLGSQSMPNTSAATFAFWCNPTLTSSTGNRGVIRYGKSNIWFNDNDGLKVYPNIDSSPAEFTSLSDPSGKYQRFVVTISGTTTKLYIDGTLIGSATTPAISTTASVSYIGQYNSDGFLPAKLSDFQIYDVAWTQADVTFDYENPQHLVTDNSASSIALSNLKGYWHLSEGAGGVVYDSSGENNDGTAYDGNANDHDNDGTVLGATWSLRQPTIPQLGLMDWSKGSNLITYSEDFSNAGWGNGSDATVTSGFTSPTGLSTAYRMNASADEGHIRFTSPTIDPSNLVSVSIFAKKGTTTKLKIVEQSYTGKQTTFDLDSGSIDAGGNTTSSSIESYGNGWYRCSITQAYSSGQTVAVWGFMAPTAGNLFLWGSQIEEASSPSAYRRTNGSTVIDATLISDPNDPSKDILDNDARLREHSLNLDGSGYAEVADDNSINPTSAITVACWVYWNETLSNGTRTNDIGIVSKWKSSTEDYMLIKGTDTTFDFYIGTDSERSDDLGMDTPGWVYIAGTYDGSTIKTYKNGVSNSSGTSVSRTIPNTAQVLEIGRYRETLDRSYPERIDEVKIYERALSADELLQNYNAGLSQHKPGSAFSDDFSSDYGL